MWIPNKIAYVSVWKRTQFCSLSKSISQSDTFIYPTIITNTHLDVVTYLPKRRRYTAESQQMHRCAATREYTYIFPSALNKLGWHITGDTYIVHTRLEFLRINKALPRARATLAYWGRKSTGARPFNLFMKEKGGKRHRDRYQRWVRVRVRNLSLSREAHTYIYIRAGDG